MKPSRDQARLEVTQLRERVKQLDGEVEQLLREDRLGEAHRRLDEQGCCLREIDRSVRESNLELVLWFLRHRRQMFKEEIDRKSRAAVEMHDPQEIAAPDKQGLEAIRQAIRAIKDRRFDDAVIAIVDAWQADSRASGIFHAPHLLRSLKQRSRQSAGGSARRRPSAKLREQVLAVYRDIESKHPKLSKSDRIHHLQKTLKNRRIRYSLRHLRRLVP